MNTVFIVVLLVCGQPDTIIIKHPNKSPTYTHSVRSEQLWLNLNKIMKGEHDIIIYQDKRGICA